MATTKVTPNELNLAPAKSYVTTNETTTSTSFVSLTTVQSVTVTIGANGICMVGISAGMGASVAAAYLLIAYEASGANTITASDTTGVYWRATLNTAGAGENTTGKTFMLTGLTPGSTTFTLKFRTTAGTGAFERREIWALPL